MAGNHNTLTVAAGQLAARGMEDAAETLAAVRKTIEEAARRGADLLVLPECAYPAYLIGSVSAYRSGPHMRGQQFVDWLGQQAAAHRMHIVSGFVEDTGEGLFNAAVFIDDAGREIGRCRKRFLWHVDHEWYKPGAEICAFDSELGRIGIIICAETRAPEIVATLVADGAELLAMPTCWINGSSVRGEFRNPQIDFLIEARAREFGIPFICADKSGVESPSIGYVGQSRIVCADGALAAAAAATGEEVIVDHIALARPKRLQIHDEDRRKLLAPGPGDTVDHAFSPRPCVVAVVSGVLPDGRSGPGGMAQWLKGLRDRGVHLLLVNATDPVDMNELVQLAHGHGMHAVSFRERGGVVQRGPARVGFLRGDDVTSFPAARVLALEGAEILAVSHMPDDLAVLQTRAAENRVFLVAARACEAMMLAPDGTVIGHTRDQDGVALVAEMNLAHAADKSVAPQTDIFLERRPSMYRF